MINIVSALGNCIRPSTDYTGLSSTEGPYFKFVGLGCRDFWATPEIDLDKIILLNLFLFFDQWYGKRFNHLEILLG